ncbi:MAG: beta-lactamase family protein [Acidobacteria bacterium]|nr:beta-lactamase family protein [Acidobacteriota bacterium]
MPLLLPLHAQVSSDTVRALERVATSWMEKEHIPALSVAVGVGDAPAWTAAWGFTDLENFVPATPRSMFRIGSIAKTFTAVAALQLAEAGRLDLDAEVQAYVPSFPHKKWPISVRQLLSHLAGIRNYQGDEFNSTRHYRSIEEALAVFAADPLVHQPGSEYLYTTYGVNLAGAAVQSAAGVSYAELVRRNIIEPAGISSMRPDDVFAVIPYRARGYRRRADGAIENCALLDTSNKLPGGGWEATAHDLVLFARALFNGRLLKPDSLAAMWTPQKLNNGKPTGYGLGWGLYQHQGVLVAEHSGTQPGIKAHLLAVPQRRIAIAVLTNLEDGRAPEIAREMFAALPEGSK